MAMINRSSSRGLPGARRAVGTYLARTFGPAPFDAASAPGDPGLHGPHSATWRVIADPAAIVGGVRGLLVQLLHPHAMAGVADHSRFDSDPLGRLKRTSAYVVTSTFGSTAEALAAAATVRGVHRRVRGTAPDGTAYRADDPHLLAWVSIALTSSFLACDRAYASTPVARPMADEFVRQQATVAALLDPRVDLEAITGDPTAQAELRRGQLPLPMIAEGRLPLDVPELDAALAQVRPELAVGEQGRQGLRFLLWPSVDAATRAGYMPLLLGALVTLTPEERHLLPIPGPSLPAGPVRAQTRALLSLVRASTGTSPALLAATRRVAAG